MKKRHCYKCNKEKKLESFIGDNQLCRQCFKHWQFGYNESEGYGDRQEMADNQEDQLTLDSLRGHTKKARNSDGIDYDE